MIHCEASIEIDAPQTAVFAFVDDFTNAPRWANMCHSLEVLSSARKAVGTKLRYSYKEGGGVRTMEGSVTGYDPPRRLEMTFSDKSFEIVVGFNLESAGAGTRFILDMKMTPRSFLGRLMSPIIRAATRRQVAKDVASLKKLLESR